MGKKRKPFRKMRHAAVVPLVKVLVFLCAHTPRRLLGWVADLIGSFLSLLPLSASDTIRLHRKKVMTRRGIDPPVRAIYSSVLRSFFDFFHLQAAGDKKFSSIVRIQGVENMRKALSPGKGAIALTAHFSAWELIPRAVRLQGFRTGVVGRKLTHGGASRILDEMRRAPGISVVDRDEGVMPIVRLLRRNTAIGILIDQDTGRVNGETADFMGLPARTPVAPAVLAVRLGVPVVPLHIKRLKDSTYLLEIEEPLYYTEETSTSEILTELNHRIEKWIIEEPEQWVWFHKRWKSTLKKSTSPV